MQRDVLLLTEMIEAAGQAQELTSNVTASDLEADRQRRDALLWNFTVVRHEAPLYRMEVEDPHPGPVAAGSVKLRAA